MRQEHAIDTAIQTLASEGNDLEIEADLRETQIAIDRQVHKLKALVGMEQDAPIGVVAGELSPIRLKLPKTLGLDLLARRPDLLAQKKRVEAAAKQIDAAKTNFYPNVNLMAFFGTDSVFWSGLFHAHNWDISANPAIHLPIFTAGRIRAELYEKVSLFNEAVYAYNKLIIDSAKEVADSLTTISSLLKEVEIYQKIYDVSAKEEGHVMRLFLGALVSRVETLDATDDVLHKKLILTEIEYAAQLAEIDLIRSLGGGFHE
ncbi:MAG: hypothetical protein FJZ64_03475 [Chlamydiae bacterium]|nr:hypothetical protein [Chlamydiota bacterium]